MHQLDLTPTRPIFKRPDGLTFEPDAYRPGLVRCSRCLSLITPEAAAHHRCQAPPQSSRASGPAPPPARPEPGRATIVRIVALYHERLAIYAALGYGGLWRDVDLSRLAEVETALAVLWEQRRREVALASAGGQPRNLGPAHGGTPKSRRIV